MEHIKSFEGLTQNQLEPSVRTQRLHFLFSEAGASPNVIRAERSEQETDGVTNRTRRTVETHLVSICQVI